MARARAAGTSPSKIGQVARVEGQQGGDLRPGRGPHQDQAPRRAAAEVLAGPGHGQGPVLDEFRKAHLGIEPVVGDHRGVAARGESLADEAVALPRAPLPAAAVEEDEGPLRDLARRRPIDVEPVTPRRAVGGPGLDPMVPLGHQGIHQPQRRAGRQGQGQQRGREHLQGSEIMNHIAVYGQRLERDDEVVP